MKNSGRTIRAVELVLLVGVFISLASTQVVATPHTGQSINVTIIGSPGVINGGFLPTTGPVGEIGDFTFMNLPPGDVNASNLAAFDTAVLNVASSEMGCTTDTLSSDAKTDLVDFVTGGKKLIIYDSECTPSVNYSWLPFPFTTNNPGPTGAQGVLTIAEENTLSTSNASDPHFINAAFLGNSTDAVGDMNVMVTRDPNWCLDMTGTNINNVTGAVHTYARYPVGTDQGLFIYNGLDLDDMNFGNDSLRKIWVQELQQPFNPSNLPCNIPVAPSPASAKGKVTGGGWITSPTVSTVKANFGFVAHFTDNSTTPSGNLQYDDKAAGLKVKGNVTALSVDKATNTSIFSGTARITNATMTIIGTYTVTAVDNGEPGRNDTFAISIPSISYAANGTLMGGNIQLHDS